MEMFLMVVALSVLGVAVSALAFGAATRDVRAEEARAAERPTIPAPQFFVDVPIDAIRTQIPIELLMLQIDRHVRLEQAAAESFLVKPTPESLHMTTTSPLVH